MKNAKIISFRETQIKARVRDSYTAMRMVTTPSMCGWRCGGIGTLIHCHLISSLKL
jgi:hypothetical protein